MPGIRKHKGPQGAAAAAAAVVSVALLGAVGAWGATVTRHVLPAGQEDALERALAPGAEVLGEGCASEGIGVHNDRVEARYAGSSCRFTLHLSHPSAGTAGAVRTTRFAITSEIPLGGGLPPDGLEPLFAHIRAHEGPIRWRTMQITADLGSWDDAAWRKLKEAADARRRGRPEAACDLIREVLRAGDTTATQRREAASRALACGEAAAAEARRALEALEALVSTPEGARQAGVDPETFPALVALTRGAEEKADEALARLIAAGEHERACAFAVEAGAAAWELGQPEEADALLGTVLTTDQGCTEANLTRIRVWAGEGDEARRAAAEKAALAAHPDDVELLVKIGLLYHVADRYDEARSLLEKAFSLRPDYPGLLGKIGSVYARAGCRDDAMKELEARIAADPADILPLYLRSACAHYRREYERCVEGLERVRARFRDEPRLYIYLGMTLFLLGQPERAEAMLREGEGIVPQDPDFYYVRSNVIRTRDLKQAISDYERYLAATAGGREHSEKRQRVQRTLAALREGHVVWSAEVIDEILSARGEVPAGMRSVDSLRPGEAPVSPPNPAAPSPGGGSSMAVFIAGGAAVLALLVVALILVRRRCDKRPRQGPG